MMCINVHLNCDDDYEMHRLSMELHVICCDYYGIALVFIDFVGFGWILMDFDGSEDD